MPNAQPKAASDIARETLRQLALRRLAPTPEHYTALYHEIAGVEPVAAPAVPRNGAPANGSADEQIELLRGMLAQSLVFSVVEELPGDTQLTDQAHALAEQAKQAHTTAALGDLKRALKDFWLKLERSRDAHSHMLQQLTSLLRASLRGMSEVAAKDEWLNGQLGKIEQLLDAPLDERVLRETERNLRDVMLKQGTRKQALEQAEVALKDMIATFVERLRTLSSSTGEFHDKVASYAGEIQGSRSIEQLSEVIKRLMNDTRAMQSDAVRTRDELIEARQQVNTYQEKVRELETALVTVSELVKEDPLTRVLNRRGLADVFKVEISRCERRAVPLSVVMIDIDNFKQLNDRHGHAGGDAALRHLAGTLREALRATDWIARYGGEEFVLLLPETSLAQAQEAMGRIQRVCAGLPFAHNGAAIALTFSAGIAQRRPGETEEEVLDRADRALYRAKAAGKDRFESDE